VTRSGLALGRQTKQQYRGKKRDWSGESGGITLNPHWKLFELDLEGSIVRLEIETAMEVKWQELELVTEKMVGAGAERWYVKSCHPKMIQAALSFPLYQTIKLNSLLWDLRGVDVYL
jgi:hypothetical protein